MGENVNGGLCEVRTRGHRRGQTGIGDRPGFGPQLGQDRLGTYAFPPVAVGAN